MFLLLYWMYFNLYKRYNCPRKSYNHEFLNKNIIEHYWVVLQITMSINNYINLARMTFAWLGTFIYLFYNSFPGQQIINASSDIFNSVYVYINLLSISILKSADECLNE